jgi:acetyl-CoA carboxylase biotin carboxyl carrier protein
VDRAMSELAHLREQAIELLTGLDRPPRNLRLRAGGVAVDITWDEGAAPAAAGPHGERPGTADGRGGPAKDGQAYLRSPAVGVFYHAREPGAEPFVSIGSAVRAGQQIGIIEAMKLMIPVEADRAAKITAVVKGNGEPVEYDEPLFAVEEAGDAADEAGDAADGAGDGAGDEAAGGEGGADDRRGADSQPR